MKPQRTENIPCPKCGETDATALELDDASVVWCANGCVCIIDAGVPTWVHSFGLEQK